MVSFVKRLIAERPWLAGGLIMLHALAAIAGLLVPYLLGPTGRRGDRTR